MRLDGEHGATRVATDPATDSAPPRTVWLHDDAAIQRLGDNPPESHWSRQNTQPLSPRWSPQARRRLATKRAALIANRESRALGIGAGMGALLAVAALGLGLLFAAANGWLPGSSSPAPDAAPRSVPAQPTRHTASPAATSFPTSTALPAATAQPTATAWPTATDATPVPTATPSPKPSPIPTRTPRPAPTPTPSPGQTQVP